MMSNSFNIVVFISGTGSNLQSIIEKQQQYKYKVKLVVSNNDNAKGLEFAQANHIPVYTFKWNKNDEFLTHVYDKIKQYNCNLIVLAGFMKILPEPFIQSFKNQIINIHPSLLPKYAGLQTHQKVLDNKDSLHGATVHYVNADLDSGKIISQITLEVPKNSDSDSLAKALLFREHSLLPYTIALIRQNRVKWHGSNLYFDDNILTKPILLND